GWMTDFTVASDTMVTFVAEPNESGAPRNGLITLKYTYGADGEVTADVKVSQGVSGQASGYDYEYDMKCFDGMYYGQMYGNNGEYNYYTWISDIGFDEDGYQMPGGTYYLFDIYVAAAPEDADNPLPPAGTYNLGSGPGMTEDMTFSYDYSYGVSIANDGTNIFEAYFNEGTLTIEYEAAI
ncbi:MAG TPA: hypothetical protein IAC04_05880, partial [Candidatus Coprenecus stercoravium]|nr:hypothetical protein [Candidatus Coprenecus stercoravium]